MILNFKYYTFCMNELCVIMKIGVDIRTLMDAQYSGVSEYTLNLLKEILKLDTVNEYRLFYNCFGDIRGQMLANLERLLDFVRFKQKQKNGFFMELFIKKNPSLFFIFSGF